MTDAHPHSRLCHVLEAVFDEIYIFDTVSLKFIETSRGSRLNLGYSTAELVRLTLLDINPGLDTSQWQALIRPLEQGTRNQVIFESNQRRKNGTVYPVEYRLQLERTTSPPLFIALAHDISQRREAEAALRRSRARLKEAQRIAHIGSWELDLVNNKLLWSEEIYRIFEIDPEHFGASYEAFLEMVHPEDRDRVNAAYTEAVHMRRPYSIEHRLLMKDGRIKYVHERCETFYDEQGQPLRSLGTVQDISDRKLAEIALQATERRFRELMEQSPFGIQVFSPDGRTQLVNPAWERITGATLKDMKDYNILHDRQLEIKGIMPYVRRAFRGEIVTTPSITYDARETPEVPVDDSVFCTRGHFYPLRDPQGKIREIVLMHEDVSARKAAEAALQDSERRFHILAQLSPVGIFRTDAEGRCVYVNERWCEMAGMEAEAARGEGWAGALHPEDRERVFREWQTAAREQRTFHTECRFQRPDGKVTWLLAQAVAERDASGDVVGYVGSITDITARKRNEEAIQNIAAGVAAQTGEAFFESLVIHLAKIFQAEHAFVGKLGDGKIHSIAACQFGRISDNIVYALEGSPCANVVGRHTCYYGEEVQRLFPRDVMLRKRNVRSYLGTPLVGSDGRPLGLIVLLNTPPLEDMQWTQAILEIFAARTSAELERLQALEALRHHRDTLEQTVEARTAEIRAQARIIEQERAALACANRELESFAYSVSHDLRAPLRAINGFAQALEEDYGQQLDGEGQDYLRRVRTASQRMGELIDDLLKLSRVSRQTLQRRPVDLSALAEDVVQELKQVEPRDTLVVRITRGLQATGDVQLLRVVLANLLGNAWKYTRRTPHPHIEFGAVQQEDGGLAYFVRDNGTGFDMRYAHKLFTAFQRLHHVEEYEGSGIGLATVARIIQRHGGRVWGEGEPGKGAVFYFTLDENPDTAIMEGHPT